MKRQEAERITTEYLKPVYGFALKRCKSLQDAEDLSQEIMAKVFCALLKRNDIENMDRYVWRIARNALSNYYRDSGKLMIGNSIDEAGELWICGTDPGSDMIMQETIEKLHKEIAYLSKQRRQFLIAYYYENKKQSEIAREFHVPVGTVKWQLFEAKKELKRGMEIMRISDELKFNPVRFASCATDGSVGSRGDNRSFFRSALSQNIEYAVWKEPKSVNEIADTLGVSPVYVESEAEFLEEYGFLIKQGAKYLCNILIEETDTEVSRLHDEMYNKAAEIFANELYDELEKLRFWDTPGITGGSGMGESASEEMPKDKNFILWALIPYIAAVSGKNLEKGSISFEDAATLRPDGGHNICAASIIKPEAVPPEYFDSMLNWSGPCWNRAGKLTLWQMDSEWSAGRIDSLYPIESQRILNLLNRRLDGDKLSKEEYAYLAERGILKTEVHADGTVTTDYQCVCIRGDACHNMLTAIGDRIKMEHKREFDAWKKPYVEAVLDKTPRHLHKMQQYRLQYSFYANGCFLLHCLKELVNHNRLNLPKERQKKALGTVIVHS